jgi:D-serine deaminase-like pyridoxal phosphate-dependent protein
MNIIKPTLLLNKERAMRNIERMVNKAKKSNVRFRPHFKTHQSAQIGEWFRDLGVNTVTVSSLDMAWYFAQYGWNDIMVAFPVNILEIDKINALAGDITFHLLVESAESIRFLEGHLFSGVNVNVWIKIDTGYKRTGILWNNFDTVIELAQRIKRTKKLTLRGLLTHSGHTYRAQSKKEIRNIYTETLSSMRIVQGQLEVEGFSGLELSIGDTPSCSVISNLGEIDEIRPGNFVFYDVMQLMIGSCSEEDIAVAVACPVVAKHQDRYEIILYGGAVHLSKEYITKSVESSNETPIYGYIALPEPQQGWGAIVKNTYISRLSQEHGIVKTDRTFFNQVNIGDILMVLPVHSCLTANLLRKYLTLEGEIIKLAPLT